MWHTRLYNIINIFVYITVVILFVFLVTNIGI